MGEIEYTISKVSCFSLSIPCASCHSPIIVSQTEENDFKLPDHVPLYCKLCDADHSRAVEEIVELVEVRTKIAKKYGS